MESPEASSLASKFPPRREMVSGTCLIAQQTDLTFPRNLLEDTFTKEWHERKGWFKDAKGAERLAELARFYTPHRARIVETLRTGIPFYATCESASPVSPSGVSR